MRLQEALCRSQAALLAAERQAHETRRRELDLLHSLGR